MSDGVDGATLPLSQNGALYFPFLKSHGSRHREHHSLGAVRLRRRNLRGDRRLAGRMEGAGRTGDDRAEHHGARRGRYHERSAAGCAQSGLDQLPAQLLGRRHGGVGRAHAGGQQPGLSAIDVCAGAANDAVHRADPARQSALGGVRAERRAAVDRDPRLDRGVPALAVPPGRSAGIDTERRVPGEMRFHNDHCRPTSRTASSTSSSPSRR